MTATDNPSTAPRPDLTNDRVEVAVIDEHILVVTMTRRDKRNAIDGEMTNALDAAFNELDDNPDLWVGVLTGGTDFFCAGTDMAATSGSPTPRGGVYGFVGRTRAKPVVAAVEGFAYGGGFEVVMACDLVVAATNARFGLPEVKRGLVATSGALFRASRVLPLNVAKHLLFSGQDLSPDDGHRYGLVNQLSEPGHALSDALDLARTLCQNSPVAVQQSLWAVDRITTTGDEDGWATTTEARRVIGASEDSKEGVAAFFEKRPPRWTGR